MPQGVQGQGSAPGAQIAQYRADGVTGSTGLRIPFFSDDFSRAFGFPDTRLSNMITEATPLREERPYVPMVGLREIRYSRPGLVSHNQLGTGPIRGLYSQAGVFGGALFCVSGSTIYRDGVSAGTIPGTDLVRFAASRTQLVAVSSGVAYLFDLTVGTSFVAIVSSVLPPVSDVACLAGRFIYSAPGSDVFYFSEINDAANVLGLSLETAETAPDPIMALSVLNDELVAFGSSTVQFFSVTTDPAAPYGPIKGRGFQRGCIAQGSVAYADNSYFWVGENRTVYRVGTTPTRVSSSSIEDKLRQCTNIAGLTAMVATFEGHEFYVLNIPGVGSFAYDISRVGTAAGAYGDSFQRGEWGEWKSFGRPQFRGRVAATKAGVALVGDDATNDIWAMQVGTYADGTDPLIRTASAFIKIEEGQPRCDALVLHCVVGVGNPVDPGSSPMVEMRYSDDQGRTFCKWRPAALGAQGAYKTRVAWKRLGQMRAPGRLVEVRCAEPVDVAFSHLELNPARPAR